jgi:D-aminopeptidase
MADTIAIPRVGILPSGPLNAITDVAGITVGHTTLDKGDVQTGVTVLLPHSGNLFLQKVPAGIDVINGFGKSVGLMQVQELGVLESPIALVNTFSVGVASMALIRDAMGQNPELGRALPTLNPLVFECNDGWLNDARSMSLQTNHVMDALNSARSIQGSQLFLQGSVGAGRGMSCHGIKGGIGTASRRLLFQGQPYTLGALVLANQGRPNALTLAGQRIGQALQTLVAKRQSGATESGPERGSIIMLLATDAPLDARQLQRVARRAAVGLARTGSDYGNGSGDIAIAFSTAYRIPQLATEPMPDCTMLHESAMDLFFQATAEATEQAIIRALFSATTVRGRDGNCRYALTDLLDGAPAPWSTDRSRESASNSLLSRY